MADYEVGDPVVAVKDIGGWSREHVPKGSRGVVSKRGGWGSQMMVIFTVEGGFFSSDRRVEIDVHDDEIK